MVTSENAERQISNHRECNTPTPCDSVIKYYLKVMWNLIGNNIIMSFYVRKAGFNTVCAMWFLKFFLMEFEGAYICTGETETLRKDPENLLMGSLGDGLDCVYAFQLYIPLFMTEKSI